MQNQPQDLKKDADVETCVDSSITQLSEQLEKSLEITPTVQRLSLADIKAFARAQIMTGQRDVDDTGPIFWVHNPITVFPKDFGEMLFDTDDD